LSLTCKPCNDCPLNMLRSMCRAILCTIALVFPYGICIIAFLWERRRFNRVGFCSPRLGYMMSYENRPVLQCAVCWFCYSGTLCLCASVPVRSVRRRQCQLCAHAIHQRGCSWYLMSVTQTMPPLVSFMAHIHTLWKHNGEHAGSST
jgi:hypothetical protein